MSKINVNTLSNELENGGPDFTHMPTVAGDPVVESGSNTDGEWTRWADGTQMCWRTITTDHPNGAEVTGGGLWISDSVSSAYPVSFVGTVTGSVSNLVETEGFWVRGIARDAPNQEWQTRGLRTSTFTVGAVGSVELFATGRWK